MQLYLTAKTDIDDLVIDYIEVQLKNGLEVSLNWDMSFVECTSDGFYARYCGVCFDEEHADGKLNELEGMKIVTVGTYSETHGGEGEHPVVIEYMEFVESDNLEFRNAYPLSPEQAPVQENQFFSEEVRARIYEAFLAESWR